MKIGGFQPLTLSDYRGCLAAIVFAQGCSFACPWCHNKSLIPRDIDPAGLILPETILNYLAEHIHLLDGVVVSGGEPTFQDDLADFVGRIKALGLSVKLDTNGSRPETLRLLFQERLVDYVAMDVKAPPATYSIVVSAEICPEAIEDSIRLIASSGVEHEFRTTLIPALLAADLAAIKAMIPAGSRYRTQIYVPVTSAGTAIPAALSSSRVGSPGGPAET
jgi:pyruvate formate lyase activating enzyme